MIAPMLKTVSLNVLACRFISNPSLSCILAALIVYALSTVLIARRPTLDRGRIYHP